MAAAIASRWAKAARTLGLCWFVIALAGTLADFFLTRRSNDPQAMFGGHVLALVMLWVGFWVGVLVLLCGVMAVSRAKRIPGVAAGWSAIAAGILGILAGCAALFWAFTQ